MRVNLLPEDIQLQLMLRSRVKTWLALWAGCVVLAGGLCAVGGWQLNHLDQRGQSIRQQIQPLQQEQQRTRHLQIELANLNSQTSGIENLLPPDRTLPLLAIVSHSAANTDGDVQTLRLSMQSTMHRAATAETSQEQRSLRLQVTIHGSASSDKAVSQFVSQLRAYGIFTKVELKSSSKSSGAVESGRQFHVELVH